MNQMGRRRTFAAGAGLEPGGIIALALLALLWSGAPARADFDQAWSEVKDKHFIVYYQSAVDQSTARQILREAEQYYDRIGERVGYTRYGNFWTWDERARIYLFPDQESFSRETGQPAWSTGFADRDSTVFTARTIVTFRQDREFFDGLLPHEISHLVLHDYIPMERIPIWFDEGVAQLYERAKGAQADQIMRALISRGQYIPLADLMRLDIRTEKQKERVVIFYAQSLSIVDFLTKKYGGASFSRLCRNLREGKPFEEALRNAYSNQLNSVKDLEEKWLRSLR